MMLQAMQRARAILILAVFVAACGEDPVDPGPGPGPKAKEPVYDPLRHLVSNPVSLSAAAGGNSAAAAEDTVAYVSLPPGTYPDGVAADIENAANASKTSVTLENGGFDPVPIPSAVGDTLLIRISGLGGTIIGFERAIVPPETPPLIVRTRPGKGKVDVPFNLLNVTVVFSEPIDRSTVTAQTIRLHRGGASGVQLAGEVVLAANGFVADLILASPLEPGTQYTLVVTTGIRDLNGDALPSEEVVSFETLGIVAYVVVDDTIAVGGCGCDGSSRHDDRVAVIDTKTHGLVKTLEFEQAKWFDVMFIPNRPFAYLTGNVTVVIDAATHEVTGTVAGVQDSQGMTTSADGRFVYAVVGNARQVAVVSTDIHETIANIQMLSAGIPFGGGVVALAPSPDGSVVYAAVQEPFVGGSPASRIDVIDVSTYSVVASTPFPGHASQIFLSPDGAYAYATVLGEGDIDEGGVYVFDTSDHSIVTRIVTVISSGPSVLTPDGAYLFVSQPGYTGGYSTIAVIETATNSVVGQIDGVQTWSLQFSPDGSRLYALDFQSNALWVIDVASQSVVTRIAVGDVADLTQPPRLAVTPDGAFVYVGDAGENALAVIDTETNTVVAEIDVGGPVNDIAITPQWSR